MHGMGGFPTHPEHVYYDVILLKTNVYKTEAVNTPGLKIASIKQIKAKAYRCICVWLEGN